MTDKEGTMAEKTEAVDHIEEARRLAAKANRPENDNALALGLASIAQAHASIAIAEQLELLNGQLAEVIDPTCGSYPGQLRVRIEAPDA